ncbi:ABC transporter, permease component [gamma proteobacterium HdN1]|nr:ABC transporter, permease component [gamma proteobacterium HdN1]
MNAQQQLIALQTIANKEVRRFLRIWPQTLLPGAITVTLYFLIFGNLIGGRIGTMGGHPYMQFIVPGLIMMMVITNSYSNVVSSFFSAKFQRSVEEMLISPMPNRIILAGYVIGGVARGLAVGLVVTLIALFFADLGIENLWVTVTILLLTATLFSLGGFINAVYAHSFDDISIVPTFVLTPLTYLGGVFYSIDMLPKFWQAVSLANPIVYIVNGFRAGILGSSDVSLFTTYSILIFCVLGMSVWAWWLLNSGRGLRQ